MTTNDRSLDEPIRFRIAEVAPNPAKELIPSSAPYFVRIAYADASGRADGIFGLGHDGVAKYGLALSEAIRSQRVFLTDWSERLHLPPPRRGDHLTLLLEAVQNQQFAPDEDEA